MKILPVVLALALAACAQTPASTVGEAPSFRVDPAWPRPLPEEKGVQLVLGQVAGIAVDDRTGHVWIIHRAGQSLGRVRLAPAAHLRRRCAVRPDRAAAGRGAASPLRDPDRVLPPAVRPVREGGVHPLSTRPVLVRVLEGGRKGSVPLPGQERLPGPARRLDPTPARGPGAPGRASPRWAMTN